MIKLFGVLDSIKVAGGLLLIDGWAAAENAGKTIGFKVMVGDSTCPLVEQALHLPSGDVEAIWPLLDESRNCRFRLRAILPEDTDGSTITVTPNFEHGTGGALSKNFSQTDRDADLTGLIKAGEDAAKAGNTSQAKELYRQALHISPDNLEVHNRRERIGGTGTYSHNFMIGSTIDPRDDIYRFFANPNARNPVREYLSDGWRTLSELLLLLERLDMKLSDCASFLEFACGFGRFTRHLVQATGASRVWVSDVVDGSVDFLCSEFGVQGFYSSPDPAGLKCERKFGIIFVLSLFSHLPATAWQPWIRALMSMLEPGGVLIFTTHGARASADMNYEVPSGGFGFVPQSESQTLDGAYYGTAFASREYVEQALDFAAPGCRVEFFPAWFWAQDAYAVFAPEETKQA